MIPLAPLQRGGQSVFGSRGAGCGCSFRVSGLMQEMSAPEMHRAWTGTVLWSKTCMYGLSGGTWGTLQGSGPGREVLLKVPGLVCITWGGFLVAFLALTLGQSSLPVVGGSFSGQGIHKGTSSAKGSMSHQGVSSWCGLISWAGPLG